MRQFKSKGKINTLTAFFGAIVSSQTGRIISSAAAKLPF
jgi:hypothetical protein